MKKYLDFMSDKVTMFIGSWYFIFIFFSMLFGWMFLQNFIKVDPFPYILLNLVLSTLAAVQGSVIMMSQKRQEEKDRAHMRDIHRWVKNCEEYVRNLDKQK